MNLKKTIELYNKLSEQHNFDEIDLLEKEINKVEDFQFSEIIEIPFRGNFQLDILMSADKSLTITEFLYQVMYILEYKPIEEFPFFKVENYEFDNMIEELTTIESKEFLTENILSSDSVSATKLKEKDELTFVVESTSNYVFISEVYWKS